MAETVFETAQQARDWIAARAAQVPEASRGAYNAIAAKAEELYAAGGRLVVSADNRLGVSATSQATLASVQTWMQGAGSTIQSSLQSANATIAPIVQQAQAAAAPVVASTGNFLSEHGLGIGATILTMILGIAAFDMSPLMAGLLALAIGGGADFISNGHSSLIGQALGMTPPPTPGGAAAQPQPQPGAPGQTQVPPPLNPNAPAPTAAIPLVSNGQALTVPQPNGTLAANPASPATPAPVYLMTNPAQGEMTIVQVNPNLQSARIVGYSRRSSDVAGNVINITTPIVGATPDIPLVNGAVTPAALNQASVAGPNASARNDLARRANPAQTAVMTIVRPNAASPNIYSDLGNLTVGGVTYRQRMNGTISADGNTATFQNLDLTGPDGQVRRMALQTASGAPLTYPVANGQISEPRAQFDSLYTSSLSTPAQVAGLRRVTAITRPNPASPNITADLAPITIAGVAYSQRMNGTISADGNTATFQNLELTGPDGQVRRMGLNSTGGAPLTYSVANGQISDSAAAYDRFYTNSLSTPAHVAGMKRVFNVTRPNPTEPAANVVVGDMTVNGTRYSGVMRGTLNAAGTSLNVTSIDLTDATGRTTNVPIPAASATQLNMSVANGQAELSGTHLNNFITNALPGHLTTALTPPPPTLTEATAAFSAGPMNARVVPLSQGGRNEVIIKNAIQTAERDIPDPVRSNAFFVTQENGKDVIVAGRNTPAGFVVNRSFNINAAGNGLEPPTGTSRYTANSLFPVTNNVAQVAATPTTFAQNTPPVAPENAVNSPHATPAGPTLSVSEAINRLSGDRDQTYVLRSNSSDLPSVANIASALERAGAFPAGTARNPNDRILINQDRANNRTMVMNGRFERGEFIVHKSFALGADNNSLVPVNDDERYASGARYGTAQQGIVRTWEPTLVPATLMAEQEGLARAQALANFNTSRQPSIRRIAQDGNNVTLLYTSANAEGVATTRTLRGTINGNNLVLNQATNNAGGIASSIDMPGGPVTIANVVNGEGIINLPGLRTQADFTRTMVALNSSANRDTLVRNDPPRPLVPGLTPEGDQNLMRGNGPVPT